MFSTWVLILGFLLHPVQAAEWEEVSRSDDITLYRKEVPDSPVLAYKAKAKLDAPLAKVISVVRDTPRLSEWSYRVKDAAILEQVSPTERIEYLHAGAPWPVKDRDAVYRSRIEFDRAAKRISLCVESVEDS